MRITLLALLFVACKQPSSPVRTEADTDADADTDTDSDTDADSDADADTDTDSDTDADSDADPQAGNPYPEGACLVPLGAGAEDSSTPTTVVGDGTAASCTSTAFVDAVASGGVVTFSCGPQPLTIELDETARIFNDTGPDIVIDGGGLITLSGQGQRRFLYMNTCDQAQGWTTSHCQNQDHPRLTVQNLSFVDGDASSDTSATGGGGAIFARGGQLKIVNSRASSTTRAPPAGPTWAAEVYGHSVNSRTGRSTWSAAPSEGHLGTETAAPTVPD